MKLYLDFTGIFAISVTPVGRLVVWKETGFAVGQPDSNPWL